MVKMVFFCRRRRDLDHAEYVRRVLEDHVPLALRHHPAMRGYVVNAVDHSPPEWPAYDSVAELTFDTLDDYRHRLYDSEAGRAVIERDVARFMGGAAAYVTTEHVQRSGPPPGPLGHPSPLVKLVCPVRRRPDLTHEAFVEHWLGRHVPLALRHHPGLVRYVTNVVGETLGDAPPLDGVAELSFADAESLRTRMFDSSDGERVIREDMARFIGATAAYRVTEWVQKTLASIPEGCR
jgi:uncharacterized protein (TIGR02118 family)